MSKEYWVFGYGSLIWRPGFDFVRSEPATLEGAHRALCVYSHHYRGTPEVPGLVFGLKPGGTCAGMAFCVHETKWETVYAYLKDREQVTGVYLEQSRLVRLASGAEVNALTYVVDQSHQQYADLGGPVEQHEFVRRAYGKMGSNVDYVLNTLEHLHQMGISDPELEHLGELLKAS